MAEENRKTVRIACTITNGIMLQLWKPGFDDGTGKNPMIHDGPGVRLNGPHARDTGAGATHRIDVPPAITEVDAEWWAKWKEQNKLNPYFDVGAIREVEEEANPL